MALRESHETDFPFMLPGKFSFTVLLQLSRPATAPEGALLRPQRRKDFANLQI
jgi:hypothetical protein